MYVRSNISTHHTHIIATACRNIPDSSVAVDLSHIVIISTILLFSILISLLLTAVNSTVYIPIGRSDTVMGLLSTMVID